MRCLHSFDAPACLVYSSCQRHLSLRTGHISRVLRPHGVHGHPSPDLDPPKERPGARTSTDSTQGAGMGIY